MKKLVIATAVALSAASASAMEFGVTASRDYANRNGFGFTVGEKFGAVGVTGGFQRFTKGANDQDLYSVTGSYDVVKLGPAVVSAKAGGVYLNNQTGSDGYAMTVGAGVDVPVTKQITVGVDAVRQYGQERVEQYDGNRITAAVKYKF